MAGPVVATTSVAHPSPHRERVSNAALFFGLGAAPAAWSLQVILDYALASHACFPSAVPRLGGLQGWDGIWWVLLAINIVAILIAAAAALVSYRSLRATRGERPGGGSGLMEAGEGRSRFLAVWGMLTSLGFMLTIAFDTIAILGVPLCGQ